MAVRYFNEGVSFQPEGKRKISQWLTQVAAREGKKTGYLNFIFVSEEIILDINKKYLHHHHYTDVITFDYSAGNTISGEMYISVDTVRANANEYCVDFRNELLRVMVHGVLHLCGYKDHTDSERKEMRDKENRMLNLFYETIT